MASKLGSQGGARHGCKIGQNVEARPVLVSLFVLGMHGQGYQAVLELQKVVIRHTGEMPRRREQISVGIPNTVGALGSDAVMWRMLGEHPGDFNPCIGIRLWL